MDTSEKLDTVVDRYMRIGQSVPCVSTISNFDIMLRTHGASKYTGAYNSKANQHSNDVSHALTLYGDNNRQQNSNRP